MIYRNREPVQILWGGAAIDLDLQLADINRNTTTLRERMQQRQQCIAGYVGYYGS
jgi:hypothetical protein